MGVTTMRIAHLSDLHYGPRMLQEADRCLAYAVDQIMALGVQVAVISGDATDHALELHAPAATRLLAQVRRLADHCPVLLLQGTFTHEPPGALDVFRTLGGRHPIHVANRIQQVAWVASGQWVCSAAWRFEAIPAGASAVFSCVPTVNKATLAAAVGAGHAGAVLGEQLAALLAGFSPLHRAARARGLPTIGVSHGTVFGCLSEHGVPMAGFDHEFTTGALFAAQAQAFLLGHIHRHQSWRQDTLCGAQCIAYAGSIGRFHHGERDDKGFLVWEVDADRANCRLVPTPARRTVDIVFEGRPDLDALRTAATREDVDGASVRVRWTIADEERGAVDRAAMLRILAGAADVQLEGRIVPLARSRAPGISQIPQLADKVRAWAQTVQVDPGPVLDCLAALVAASPEDIAAQVLASSPSTGVARPSRPPSVAAGVATVC